jgi:hypothetical protein
MRMSNCQRTQTVMNDGLPGPLKSLLPRAVANAAGGALSDDSNNGQLIVCACIVIVVIIDLSTHNADGDE